MKLGKFVFAALAIAAIALAGCGNPSDGTVFMPPGTGPGPGPGPAPVEPVWTTIFDLSADEHFQGLAPGAGLDEEDVFGGMMLVIAGGSQTIDVVASSPNALRLTTDADWGQGFDLRQSAFNFVAGDTIHMAGTIASIGSGRLQINRNVGGEDAIYGTVITENGAFAIDHALTQSDVDSIAAQASDATRGLRVELRVVGGVVTFTEIRVEGYRIPDADGGDNGAGDNGGNGMPAWLGNWGWDDLPLGPVAGGDFPADFAPGGGSGDVTFELVPEGLRVTTIAGWAGFDLAFGGILSDGDTLRIEVIAGAGTPVGQQLMIQHDGDAGWDDQRLGDLISLTAGEAAVFEHVLTPANIAANLGSSNPPPGNIRVRLNNPGVGSFIITNISVD